MRDLPFQQLTTPVHGLKYVPWFDQEINQLNFEDSHQVFDHWVQAKHPEVPLYHGHPTFTPMNCSILEDCVKCLGSSCNAILEIGVSRDHPTLSSTYTLLKNKPASAIYAGVDLRDLKNDFHKPEQNQYFMQSDSRNQKQIRQFLKEAGINQLDLFFIDGHHSMEIFLNDWLYTDLVRSGGYVVFHDVSHHPGPYMFYDAIDENQYTKSKHCLNDYGMAICRKK
jgi:hypothetical protein